MKETFNLLRKNCLLLVFCMSIFALVLSCDSGGGGDDGPAPDTPHGSCTWIAGTWETTENATGCDDSWIDNNIYEITQTDCSITVSVNGNTFSGSVSGNNVTWSGSFIDPDNGGTVTIDTLNGLTISGNTFSGPVSWTWSDGTETCSGTTQVSGTQTRVETKPTDTDPIPGPESLTFFEEELVGKWSRYHAYDGSNMYFIFNSDRTACYFEYSSGGSRIKNTNYINWRLDEDNPVGDNRFTIEMQYGSGSWKRIDEYDYNTDEIWKGGYSNLDMGHSTTPRDCE